MASNYTSSYQLCQWESGDKVLRTDFNADNQKIDAALGAMATKTELAHKAQLVTGTYTGDGTASRIISLGFRPKAVLLFPEDGITCFFYCDLNHYDCYGGLILDGHPLRLHNNRCNIVCAEITDSGFSVTFYQDQSKAANIVTNLEGKVFHYIALK